MTPYILVFAAVFSLAGYGLYRRTRWAWWGGWMVLFLVAGIYGIYAYSALYNAQTTSAMLAAFAWLGGGALVWIPAAIWWSGRRGYFGQSGAVAPKTVDKNDGGPRSEKGVNFE